MRRKKGRRGGSTISPKRPKRRTPKRSSPARARGRRSSLKGKSRPVSVRRSKLPPKRRTGRTPSIGKKIRETERAITTLGAENIKRGKKPLGKTRKLTPTKQGFRALRRTLAEINQASKVGKKRVFTYDLEGSYRGPDGKLHSFKMEGVGIPRLRDVKPKKGESKEDALNRVVQRRITDEIRSKILRGSYKAFGVSFGRKMSREDAAEELRKLKQSRQASFTVTFNRET